MKNHRLASKITALLVVAGIAMPSPALALRLSQEEAKPGTHDQHSQELAVGNGVASPSDNHVLRVEEASETDVLTNLRRAIVRVARDAGLTPPPSTIPASPASQQTAVPMPSAPASTAAAFRADGPERPEAGLEEGEAGYWITDLFGSLWQESELPNVGEAFEEIRQDFDLFQPETNRQVIHTFAQDQGLSTISQLTLWGWYSSNLWGVPDQEEAISVFQEEVIPLIRSAEVEDWWIGFAHFVLGLMVLETWESTNEVSWLQEAQTQFVLGNEHLGGGHEFLQFYRPYFQYQAMVQYLQGETALAREAIGHTQGRQEGLPTLSVAMAVVTGLDLESWLEGSGSATRVGEDLDRWELIEPQPRNRSHVLALAVHLSERLEGRRESEATDWRRRINALYDRWSTAGLEESGEELVAELTSFIEQRRGELGRFHSETLDWFGELERRMSAGDEGISGDDRERWNFIVDALLPFVSFIVSPYPPRVLEQLRSGRYLAVREITRGRIALVEDHRQSINDRFGDPPDVTRLENAFGFSLGDGQIYLDWLRDLEIQLEGWEGRFSKLYSANLLEPSEAQAQAALRMLSGTPEERIRIASEVEQWQVSPPHDVLLIRALLANTDYEYKVVYDEGFKVVAAADKALAALAETLPPGAARQELALRLLFYHLHHGYVYFREVSDLYPAQLYNLTRRAYAIRWPKSKAEEFLKEEKPLRLVRLLIPNETAQRLKLPAGGYWDDVPARHMGDLLGYLEVWGELPPEEVPIASRLSREPGISLKLWEHIQSGDLRVEVNNRHWDKLENLFPRNATVTLKPTAGLEEREWQDVGLDTVLKREDFLRSPAGEEYKIRFSAGEQGEVLGTWRVINGVVTEQPEAVSHKGVKLGGWSYWRPAAGLEEAELWVERVSGEERLFHVGRDRWIKTREDDGISPFTQPLIELLREPGFLQEDWEVLDLGTGDGVIPIAIADQVRHIDGTELNLAMLRLARENVKRNSLENVEILSGNLTEPVRHKGKRYDLIVAQPPAFPLSSATWKLMRETFVGRDFDAFRMAADGGEDGRRVVEGILLEAPDVLKEGGVLLLVHPEFIDLEKTRSFVQKHGLRMEIRASPEIPSLTLPEPGSVLDLVRSDIERRHGFRFRVDGDKLLTQAYILEITAPAAGLEEVSYGPRWQRTHQRIIRYIESLPAGATTPTEMAKNLGFKNEGVLRGHQYRNIVAKENRRRPPEEAILLPRRTQAAVKTADEISLRLLENLPKRLRGSVVLNLNELAELPGMPSSATFSRYPELVQQINQKVSQAFRRAKPRSRRSTHFQRWELAQAHQRRGVDSVQIVRERSRDERRHDPLDVALAVLKGLPEGARGTVKLPLKTAATLPNVPTDSTLYGNPQLVRQINQHIHRALGEKEPDKNQKKQHRLWVLAQEKKASGLDGFSLEKQEPPPLYHPLALSETIVTNLPEQYTGNVILSHTAAAKIPGTPSTRTFGRNKRLVPSVNQLLQRAFEREAAPKEWEDATVHRIWEAAQRRKEQGVFTIQLAEGGKPTAGLEEEKTVASDQLLVASKPLFVNEPATSDQQQATVLPAAGLEEDSVGSEKISAEQIQQAIQEQRNFVSMPEKPTPGGAVGQKSLHRDVAAVLAGTKRSAVIPVQGVSPLTQALVEEARRLGFGVQEAQVLAYGIQEHYIVSKKPEDAAEIAELYQRWRDGEITLPQYDQQFGELLGYSPEAIADFQGRLGRDISPAGLEEDFQDLAQRWGLTNLSEHHVLAVSGVSEAEWLDRPISIGPITLVAVPEGTDEMEDLLMELFEKSGNRRTIVQGFGSQEEDRLKLFLLIARRMQLDVREITFKEDQVFRVYFRQLVFNLSGITPTANELVALEKLLAHLQAA